MGDNVIHYLGHVKMMAAVQPFISGAISKTVNMPEEVSVEDVEQLHIDAWKMGIKAIAIYRDNCKVAQPLSTVKKTDDLRTDAQIADDARVLDLAGGTPTRREAELEAKLAELEKSFASTTTVVRTPVRERLPRKRMSNTFSFRVADCEAT